MTSDTEPAPPADAALPEPAPPEYPQLRFALDVDVCVVGAGLAGLTVARELAQGGLSVAVLEGRQVGWSASSHQLGTVMPGFGVPPADLIARVGLDDTRDLWTLSKYGALYVRATAELIPGLTLSEGALEVSTIEGGDQLIERLQLLGHEFGTEVEGWQIDQVRAALRTDRYFHAVHYPTAFQLDGRRYLHGLAELAVQAGARIYEGTPVISIDPEGIRKRIVTPQARLRASHIVLAGNVHLGATLQRLTDTLLPVWRYAGVTAPLGDKLAEAVGFSGSVADSDGVDHFRVVGGDRLLWSSPETTFAADPARFAGAIARRIRTVFPQLGEVGDRAQLCRRDRPDRARHAADRAIAARAVGGERVRPAGAQHHGGGRQVDRAGHPAPAIRAGNCSRRSNWSGRAAGSAGSPARPSPSSPAAMPPRRARWRAITSGRGRGSVPGRHGARRPAPMRCRCARSRGSKRRPTTRLPRPGRPIATRSLATM